MLLEKGKKIVDLNREHVERVAMSWFDNMTDEEQEVMLSMWQSYLIGSKNIEERHKP